VARAGIRSVGANVDVARANVDAAQTKLKKAEADLVRDKALFAERSITKSLLDNTQATFDNAQKALLVAQDQVFVAEAGNPTTAAQIARAQATVKARQAALDNARIRLGYCHLVATVGGKTGKNNLVAGQYVQPGQTLLNLVDDAKYWVVANFKETQIANLAEGQEVEITLDAYKKEPLKGKIVSLSEATGAKFSLLPPDNATGNFVKVAQRLPVKIEFDDVAKIKDKLRAGLSVEVVAPHKK
jgi:membrane fusion protein (multidrug efflux system)